MGRRRERKGKKERGGKFAYDSYKPSGLLLMMPKYEEKKKKTSGTEAEV